MDILKTAEEIVGILSEKGLTVTFTESMTGGMLAAGITSVPGASDVLKGSLVTYSDGTKMSLAGVSAETLDKYTAVSRETALEMARGGRETLGADICVSVTGNAGPGASCGKDVGTVFIGISTQYRNEYRKFGFTGSREEIRNKAMKEAYGYLLEILQNDHM